MLLDLFYYITIMVAWIYLNIYLLVIIEQLNNKPLASNLINTYSRMIKIKIARIIKTIEYRLIPNKYLLITMNIKKPNPLI